MIWSNDNDGGYAYRRDMRRAWQNWMKETDADLFVTTSFSQNVDSYWARLKIARFLAYIDNNYIGRSWTKRPSEERTAAFIFPENMESNLHYHWLMRLPVPTRPKDLELRVATLKRLWRKIEPHGTCEVALIRDEGAAQYSTKQLVRPGYLDKIILASEFHPQRG